MTIVYVDDDEDDVELFCEAIAKIRPECHCKVANDGQKGITLLAQISPPNYIFLDINMPVMNGYETLIAIRKNENLNNTRVVVLSTVIKQREIIEYKAAGANECIIKPTSFAELCAALAAILPLVKD